jgi:protein-arginine kinase activator protein McsA
MRIAIAEKHTEFITRDDEQQKIQPFGKLLEDIYRCDLRNADDLKDFLNNYGIKSLSGIKDDMNELATSSLDNDAFINQLVYDTELINKLYELQNAYRATVTYCLDVEEIPEIASLSPEERLKMFQKNERFQRYLDTMEAYSKGYSISYRKYSFYTDYVLEEYEVDGIAGILFVEFKEMVSRGIQMKKCKNCNRLFAVTGKGMEYCSHVYKDGKTCREIGATNRYYKYYRQSELNMIYKRGYNYHFYKFRKGGMSREELDEWIQDAKHKLEEVKKGLLSQDDFESWTKT